MKSKCPHCQAGCDKCNDGFFEVSFPENKDMYVNVCMNKSQCGFEIGGGFYSGHPDKPPPDCCMCHKPSEWILVEDYDPQEPPAWIENQKKFHIEKLERDCGHLRAKIKELQKMYLYDVPSNKPFSVIDAQLLNVCRICKKTQSAPFVLNYGEEYAHADCLEKEQDERQGSHGVIEARKPD